MKNWLEKQFRLSEFHTDVKTEILAGLTTFVTMAYILATVPNIMSGAGFDKHVTLTIMILLIIVTTCAMALYTNRPFALAPVKWSTVYSSVQRVPSYNYGVENNSIHR